MTEPPDHPRPASPSWWPPAHGADAADPIPAGRGRPPLPVDEILTEAFALLSEGGIEGLGMRALARRLGSSTSTLYRQFPGGKDELCARLAERVMTEIVDEIANADLGEDWAEIVERSATISFDALRRRPHSAALFADQVHFGPMGVVRYEVSLQLLLAAGLSPTEAAAADHALARLIVGYALQSPQVASPSRYTVSEFYGRLDPDEFPSVTTVLPTLPEDLRAEFLFALRTIMAGLRLLAADPGDVPDGNP